MRKIYGIVVVAVVAVIAFWSGIAMTQERKIPGMGKIPAFGTDKIPSYFEMDEYNHRYPETDTDFQLYMNEWTDSHVTVGHGGFIERAYFVPGDPTNPPRKAHVLKYMKAYNHGILEAGCQTEPTMHENEQVFFFVVSGKGKVEAGGQTAEISDGTGVFMPARLTYTFTNTCPVNPMHCIIVVEEIPDDFEPLTEMKVGTYKDKKPSAGMHWAHIGHGIVSGTKFYNPVGFAVVSMQPMDAAQPHMHGPGVEEIWCQIKGESLLIFGNRLYKMPAGMAFYAVPNYAVPHCSINPGDKPVYWLYMGNRHDRGLGYRQMKDFHKGWNWE